jgi:hypothetical protein
MMLMETILIAILSHGAFNTKVGLDEEVRVIEEVSAEYHLTSGQTKLLAVIRRIENGGPSNELGVGSEDHNHPARRFAAKPLQSLRIQAQWAAGTIQRRYDGDLDKFAARWCPDGWQTWARNAAFYMGMKP